MTNKEIYKILARVEYDFKQPPDKNINNYYGLCYSLIKKNVSETDIKKILGDRYYKNRLYQWQLYKTNSQDELYEKSNWCANRKLDFKKVI